MLAAAGVTGGDEGTDDIEVRRCRLNPSNPRGKRLESSSLKPNHDESPSNLAFTIILRRYIEDDIAAFGLANNTVFQPQLPVAALEAGAHTRPLLSST